MKKVYIRTFGCQMNFRDSEVICGLLRTMNYELSTKPEEVDIIIFNTCSVRQHAEEKVWSQIGRFNKGQSPSGTVPIIGVVGCMAQNYKEEIFKRAPQVSFVVGPSDIHKIPEIVKELCKKQGQSPKGGDSPCFLNSSNSSAGDSPCFLYERKIWETDGSIRPEAIYHTGFYEDKEHGFVVISEGCSNFCSYCVVPYVRGALRNRDYKDILREIEEAMDKGITKITLLGQNVNAYKCQVTKNRDSPHAGTVPVFSTVKFSELLRMVNEIKGLKEFSFITSHPKDTSLDLFKAMADLEKLKKYLHLPVQSGSDKILKLMNRSYTRKFYLDLIDNYRKIVKDAVLTTDIIVGFPTETEEDFQETYDLVKNIEFDAAYIFKYSTRLHTEAANMVDDVEKKEKERRHKLILDLQKEISRIKQA